MQGGDIKRRPSGCHERRQLENEQGVSRSPMVFVHLPPAVHAPQNPDGKEILHQTSHRLQNDQNIRCQADYAVGGRQACMVALVDFDGKKGQNEPEQTEGLDVVVDACSSAFLGWQAGWLQNKACLDLQKESS